MPGVCEAAIREGQVTSSSGAFSATIKVIKGMTSAWWIPVCYGAAGYYDSSSVQPRFVTVH